MPSLRSAPPVIVDLDGYDTEHENVDSSDDEDSLGPYTDEEMFYLDEEIESGDETEEKDSDDSDSVHSELHLD